VTNTQKRWLEWPILIFIFWVTYALNIFLTGKFGGVFSFLLILVCNTYIVMTRNIFKSFFIVFFLSWICSPMVGIDSTYFVAAQLICGMIAKMVLLGLALEGRVTFAVTTMSTVFAQSVFLVGTILYQNFYYSFWVALGHAMAGAILHGVLAYFIYPMAIAWDEYFEHEPELSSHSSLEEVRG
jgi:hypothetical protein